ncbi:MAG: hypothetical protein ACFE89_12825 [Candidatus Hodarchaeota archaeon]
MLQILPLPIFEIVTIGTLLLVGLTLGLFFLVYFIMMAYAAWNPWVREVKRMNWCCNPAFDIWYYEHKRRKWVAANFVGSIILALLFWFILLSTSHIYYITLYGVVTYTANLVYTITLGIGLLALIGYGITKLHSPS